MHIFLINLDRASERLSFMSRQFADLSLPFERFSAIDGKTLSKHALHRLSAPCRQWIAMGRLLTPSEIACTASHLAIFHKIVSRGLPMAIIFEDDMRLLPTLPKWLKRLEKTLNPDSPTVCQLAQGTEDVHTDHSITPITSSVCAGAYVITLAGAKWLLKLNKPIIAPIDHWGRWYSRGLNLLLCQPRVAGHWERTIFGSMMDTEKPRSSFSRLGGGHGKCHLGSSIVHLCIWEPIFFIDTTNRPT